MNRYRRVERHAVRAGLPVPPPPHPFQKAKEEPREKTNAEIIEEKMAAMAADPDAVPVYWTEFGPDPKGWDIIFPEYKILVEAFKGGYGWWDLTEGRGQHLLPKPKPYKIVNITSAELKVIRTREAEEMAAAAAEAQRIKEEKLAALRRAALQKEEEQRAAKAEADRMAEEDARAALLRRKDQLDSVFESIMKEVQDLPEENLRHDFLADFLVCRLDRVELLDRWALIERLCPEIERKIAEEDTRVALLRRTSRLESAFSSIMEEVRDLPEEMLYQSFLIDFIVDRIDRVDALDRDALIERICPAIEREGLMFVTAHSSPVGSRSTSPSPEEPEPIKAHAKVHLVLPKDLHAFLQLGTFHFNGTMYSPALDVRGYPICVPLVNVTRLPIEPIYASIENTGAPYHVLAARIIDPHWMLTRQPPPLPPLPLLLPPPSEVCRGLCCVPPPLPPLPPPSEVCRGPCCIPPPPPPKLPGLLPTPVKPQIKIKNLRMPSIKRIKKFVDRIGKPVCTPLPLVSSSLRDWRNPVTRLSVY